MTRDKPSIHQVFRAFLRLGLTAFGGPTMVAYIRELAVEKKRWLSKHSFQNGVALCQSIPGATAMQMAAYTGLRAGGPWGALAAYAGFGLPAFVLMVILSALYRTAHALPPVISAFRGLELVVIALMANATLTFAKGSIRDWRDALLAIGAALFLGFHGSPLIAIAVAALLGLFLIRGAREDIAPRDEVEKTSWEETRWAAIAMLAIVAAGLVALVFLDRVLFDLSALMVKVDVFAFGGGFASVPLMMHEVVKKRLWLDGRGFMDGIALGQVTPGPIVITATFVGYQVRGIPGAVAATAGIFAPSFFMVLVTVPFLDRLQHSRLFHRALRGILVSFFGLLLAVTVHFALATAWSPLTAGLAAAVFVALRAKIDILWVVLLGALVSVLVL